ncbi:MAG: alpha/beta fold hydrolase [Actinobacteria bacterium]|nr:alpha/beta fold hydrolase [Actinomycetota bacterium]
MAAEHPTGPPSRWKTAAEALSGLEAIRLATRTQRLSRSPLGDDGPVILVPGLGATDVSMLPLRRFLRERGHRAKSAGFGRIHSDVPLLARQLIERADAFHRESGRKVALIGWSLGGLLSRETARNRPDLIERVITFGTPVVGGPAHTAFARRYTDDEIAQIEILINKRSQVPIEVPITAIWSRRDGVVSGRACVDHYSPNVENLEVSSTHLGMALDPDVWSIIAKRLAA